MNSTPSNINLREKVVVKAVRNIRRGENKEDPGKSMYRPGIKLDLDRSRLMTQSYKVTEGEAMVIRRAKALNKVLSEMVLYINDWEKIVGNNVSKPQNLFFSIDMNWRSVKRIVSGDEGKSLLDDEGRAELEEIVQYWKGKSMSDRQQAMFTGDVLKYWSHAAQSPARWSHWSDLGIPNYEKVLDVGLKGLIEEAQTRLQEIDESVPDDYIDQKDFLQAAIISLKGVITYARRYAELARHQAEQTDDQADKERLEGIAKRCDRVPENPPETLAEALQAFFILHVARNLEFMTAGIGVRFDKVFGPYYENDLKNGRITREEGLELLKMLWVKFHELGLLYSPSLSAIYGGVAALQTIMIGGVDDHGNDITNEMSYLVLEVAQQMQTPEPTIGLRYHDKTPTELLSKAVDVLHTGIGYPALFNDKSIIPLLEEWDVPIEDARDYAISGCVYLEIPGKNICRKAIGGLNMPWALWYALHQGVNTANNIQRGAPTPDPRTFESIDDLMDAYLAQVRFFMKRLMKVENTCHSLYEKYLPRPFYSALLDGCIEQGKETKQWGYPSPVSNFCIMLGPTNTADGFTAIKKLVFEEKKITMDELITAMDANWDGHEHIHQMVLNAPKFGNDNNYADEMAGMVQNRTCDEMAKLKNRFGYPVRGDGSGISATYAVGAIVPATPDGRKAFEPLADGTLSPAFGRDTNGPTAVLKSASKIDTTKTYNHLLNQKFLPSALEGPMKDVFIGYLRSWGELDISHVQFNVVDRQTLLDAQDNPDAHADILVRVAGYSAFFIDLSKGLQDSIIARTEQSF